MWKCNCTAYVDSKNYQFKIKCHLSTIWDSSERQHDSLREVFRDIVYFMPYKNEIISNLSWNSVYNRTSKRILRRY